MTAKITIHIEADSAFEARCELDSLINTRQLSREYGSGSEPTPLNQMLYGDSTTRPASLAGADSLMNTTAPAAIADEILGTNITGSTTPAKRERGKPSAGHARRTKAEIAEDDAADKADAEAAARAAGHAPDKQVETEVPGISTGENRVDPNNPEPEDDEATAAADAADEAAETAATSDVSVLTHDSVRNELGKYRDRFGMEATMQDGPKVLQLVCGEGVVKISDIPDDQAVLKKVVAGIREMSAKNPFSRKAVA